MYVSPPRAAWDLSIVAAGPRRGRFGPVVMFASLALSAGAPAAPGDGELSERDITNGRGRALREAHSASGEFELRVWPARSSGAAACRAELRRSGVATDEGAVVWQRELRNDAAPTHAVVWNDGRFVVTLDEFRRGGARHALVVYDHEGTPLHERSLAELLRGGDWSEVRVRGRAIDWLEGATFGSEPQPPVLTIRTRWDRNIRIDLTTGEVTSDSPEGDDGGPPPQLARLLDAGAGGAQDRSERMADQLALMMEQQAAGEPSATAKAEVLSAAEVAIQAEIAAADDAANAAELQAAAEAIALARAEAEARDAEAARLEAEARAAAEAAALAAAQAEADAVEPATADESPEAHEATDAAPSRSAPDADAPIEAGDGEQGAMDASTPAEPPRPSYDAGGPAGMSAEVGVAVPMPDPANPVNYLAWVNAQTSTPGANAWPQYQRALSSMKPYEGNPELLDLAMEGDELALQSQDVQQWLRGNLASLQALSAGNALPYRGIPLKSDDGSMLGALLPHLGGVRELSRASIVAGRMMESEGSYAEAADFYLDSLASGANIGGGPTMIENMVGVAIQSKAADAILDLFSKDAAADLDYAGMLDELNEAYRAPRPVAETVQFERAMVLDALQAMYRYDEASGKYLMASDSIERFDMVSNLVAGEQRSMDPIDTVLTLGGLGFERMVAEANGIYDEMTESVQLPYPQSAERLNALEARFSDPTFRAANPLLADIAPALSRYSFLATRAESTRRATTSVARLQAYRQAHGAFPESLAELGDAPDAIDPFTGRPFAYRRTAEGFSLYSAGANGADDGGVHDERGETNDLVYWPRRAD